MLQLQQVRDDAEQLAPQLGPALGLELVRLCRAAAEARFVVLADALWAYLDLFCLLLQQLKDLLCGCALLHLQAQQPRHPVHHRSLALGHRWLQVLLPFAAELLVRQPVLESVPPVQGRSCKEGTRPGTACKVGSAYCNVMPAGNCPAGQQDGCMPGAVEQ